MDSQDLHVSFGQRSRHRYKIDDKSGRQGRKAEDTSRREVALGASIKIRTFRHNHHHHLAQPATPSLDTADRSEEIPDRYQGAALSPPSLSSLYPTSNANTPCVPHQHYFCRLTCSSQAKFEARTFKKRSTRLKPHGWPVYVRLLRCRVSSSDAWFKVSEPGSCGRVSVLYYA